MARAKVKTKSGATVTIEGSPREISEIVSCIDQIFLSNKTGSTGGGSPPSAKVSTRGGGTASARVLNLKNNGYFNKPRGLGEIGAELEKEGFLYPVTTLSGVMLALVQRRILSRIKKGKVWVYGKR